MVSLVFRELVAGENKPRLSLEMGLWSSLIKVILFGVQTR